MHILIEPSDYIIRNAGDTAMSQIVATRLVQLWPKAVIQVFTDVPEFWYSICPTIKPLDTIGRRKWLEHGFLFRHYSNSFSDRIKRRVWELESFLRRHWPALVLRILKNRIKSSNSDLNDLDNFMNAISKADLIVVSGMGGITDAFPEYASDLLDIVSLGKFYGADAAMMGQGIGPLENPRLRIKARKVLSKVDLISLREERTGLPILKSLGIPAEHIMTTGDDAIEMAYQLRTDNIGNGIGINIRLAYYSEVDMDLIDPIRSIIQEASYRFKAPLLPIPISRVPGEEDAISIQQLMSGSDELSDGGKQVDTPLKVIEQIKRCRVVVVGSYHAGVFALSLGVPVIGLAKSTYYVDKFLGLADQFGTGCQVILFDDSNWQEKLKNAIEQSWQTAEKVKPELLDAAKKQIDLGYIAYRKVYELANKA